MNDIKTRKLCRQIALGAFAIAAGQATGIVFVGQWWWWVGISLGLFFWALAEVL